MLTMIAAMAARRFAVRADELLTAFGELEAEISHAQASAEPVAACQAMPYKLRYNSANCLSRLSSAVFSSNKLLLLPPQQQLAMSRHASPRGGFLFCSRIFEIALVPVCLDHVASFIVNANHCMMRSAAKHRVADVLPRISIEC